MNWEKRKVAEKAKFIVFRAANYDGPQNLPVIVQTDAGMGDRATREYFRLLLTGEPEIIDTARQECNSMGFEPRSDLMILSIPRDDQPRILKQLEEDAQGVEIIPTNDFAEKKLRLKSVFLKIEELNEMQKRGKGI